MRGVWKLALALATVALLTAALSACGGGDSDDSTAAATTRESTIPVTNGGQGSKQGGKDREGGKESGDDNGGSSSDSDDTSSDEGSASFRTPGGDNSIQDYGDEAAGAEREAASVPLRDYLEARANDDWAKECALLAKAAVAPIEQFIAHSPQFKGKGCAAILKTLMGQTPSSARANPMTAGIASLRFEGNRGFALFHGAGDVNFFVPMIKEDGKWKVGAIAPTEIP